MAEFMTHDEAKSKFASKNVGNAGLTLGIIGTALSALNSGILGGNGILGLGGSGNAATTMAAGALGAGLASTTSATTKDQEFNLWNMGQMQIENLKNDMELRERDISEKVAIYKQGAADDIRIQNRIADVKDYATAGLVDVYKENAKDFRNLEKTVGQNKLDSYKDIADLYRVSVTADKNLELQIERNRELDQAEKFGLYKDLSGQTNSLAYKTMKQSYEDRIDSMKQVGALAARVSELEKNSAVTAAQLPLMFQLADSNTHNSICAATRNMVTGNVTINPCQIANPIPPVPYPFISNPT